MERVYTVIYEKGKTGWGAYVPDLPGCVAAGRSVEEVKALMPAAIKMHIEGMIEDGVEVPEPASQAERITVAA